MYTQIYKGYEIFFTYAFDSYAARPVGSTTMENVPYFKERADAEKYADEHPLSMDVQHDVIEFQTNGRSLKAVFNVYMPDLPLRPLHTTIHGKNQDELIHKIAVYLGVKHKLEPVKDIFDEI